MGWNLARSAVRKQHLEAVGGERPLAARPSGAGPSPASGAFRSLQAVARCGTPARKLPQRSARGDARTLQSHSRPHSTRSWDLPAAKGPGNTQGGPRPRGPPPHSTSEGALAVGSVMYPLETTRASGGIWQTRRIQVPVSARTWGFKSPLAHVLVSPEGRRRNVAPRTSPLKGTGTVRGTTPLASPP